MKSTRRDLAGGAPPRGVGGPCPRTSARGFTLLEVLVSVAILGLGLTAILSAQAGAFASSAHARNISVATGLLRCKMTEVEEHLYKEGFQETDETGSGPCCEGDETPNMRCTWRADRPTFPDGKFGDMNLDSALNLGGSGGPAAAGSANPMGALGLLAGMGGPSPMGSASSLGDVAKTFADANSQANAQSLSSSPSPSLSSSSSSSGSTSTDMDSAGGGMGGLASLAMSIVYPSLKVLFEASTRRITSSLTFREGNKEYTIDVVEWFSIPQKGLSPTDDGTGGTSTTTGTGTGTGTRTLTSTKTGT
jgi:general secretion pathway protein I